MRYFKVNQQRGAVLVIALVMLLVLTLLAINSMRGVTLETRMTRARIENTHLTHLVDAALREGEFRLYGSDNLRDKLEPNLTRNCVKANTLNNDGQHRPCLLAEMSRNQLQQFFAHPIRFFNASNSYTQQYTARTGSAVQAADAHSVLAWMPYRGLDPQPAHYSQPIHNQHAYWNSYRIKPSTQNQRNKNPEYGAALEGQGTFYYLVTAQANERVAAQSTVAVIYLGLNQ